MMIFGPVRYTSDIYLSSTQYHHIKLIKKEARQVKHGLDNHKDKNQMKLAFKAFNSIKETAMIADPSIDTKDTTSDIVLDEVGTEIANLNNYGDRLVNGRTLDNEDEPEPEYSDGYRAVGAFNLAFKPGNSVGKAKDYDEHLRTLVALAGSAIISENNSAANIKAHNEDLIKKLTSGI